MIDLKPQIVQALRNAAALVDLLGGRKIWAQLAPVDTLFPYITFFEIVNTDTGYADNQAHGSEIHVQVDIWASGSTSQLAIETNQVMEAIGFIRTSSIDGYDREAKTYRKILRYKTITRR